MIDIVKYLNFIIDNKLTQEQYTFMYLLYYSRIDPDATHRLVKKYKKYIEVNALISKGALQDLVDKKFIKLRSNSNVFEDFVLTEKFLDILVDEQIVAEQAWNLYPGFTKDENSGHVFPLKSFDFESFKRIYTKAIMYSKEEHNEIMKDLRFGVQKGLIKYKVETFVKGKGWLDIRKLRLSSQGVATKNPAKVTDL